MKHFVLMLMMASTVFGYQLKHMNGEQRLSFKVSLYDLNRIEIPGDRILKVYGTAGTFTMDHDEERGDLYIKPLSKRPLSLTLTTEKGLIQDLTLIPEKIPSETISLKARGASIRQTMDQKVLSLIKVMAGGISKKELIQDHREEVLGTFQNARLKRVSTYSGEGLFGEKIEFKNLGETTLLLREDLFYEEGVLAVSLDFGSINPSGVLAKDSNTLDPGNTLTLYRVREADA